MAEPTTSGAGAAGFAAFKAAGGIAGIAGLGAALAAVVVMLMTPPRSPREWAVGLICTVLGSICGGAAVISYFHLQGWMYTFEGLVALLGVVFTCGLPAWAVVRWIFTFIERRKDKDLGEVVESMRGKLWSAKGPGAAP